MSRQQRFGRLDATEQRVAEPITRTVQPHPDVQARQDAGLHTWLHAAVKFSAELRVPRNLEQGDQLLVTVTGPDGEQLAQGYTEIHDVAFVPLEGAGDVIGEVRVHKAKKVQGGPTA